MDTIAHPPDPNHPDQKIVGDYVRAVGEAALYPGSDHASHLMRRGVTHARAIVAAKDLATAGKIGAEGNDFSLHVWATEGGAE